MSDLLNAVLVGLTVGVLSIGLLSIYPGEPFKFDTTSTSVNEDKPENDINATRTEEQIVNSKKLQKIFGCTADELRSSLAREREKSANTIDNSFSICRFIEYGAYIFLMLILFFAINVWSQGEFGQIVAGTESLFFSLKSYSSRIISLHFRIIFNRNRISGSTKVFCRIHIERIMTSPLQLIGSP